MTTIEMSLRNVFRYRRRSMITAAAIAFGVMCTIAIDGMLVGTERESSRNIRDYETGEVKVYPPDYFADRKTLPFDKFIEPADRKLVESALAGRQWTPRVNLSAELYFNEDFFAVPGSIQATLTAVDPERDGTVLRTAGKVDEGRWLRKGDTGVVIGSWLAEDIGAKPGYVMTVECKGRGGFYQTFDAEIIGVVTTENPIVNKNGVFMDLDEANALLALDGAVTEYVIRSAPGKETDRTVAAIRNAAPGVDPRSWEEVAYDEILLTKTKSSGSKIYIFFIFIIAAVGISNTMLMAVMERKNEIGMLRALGYGNFGIRWQFLLEGFWIGLIGSAMGLAGGLLANLYMVSHGVDFSFMFRDMDVGYRITGIMRSAWNAPGIIASIVGAVAISTFVAWFPSGKILKKKSRTSSAHRKARMKIAKTAWRNMWRNRTRTIISATAILVSSLVVSLLIAFQEGFVNDMKTNVVNDVTGDVRVMNETYVRNERIMPLQFCVPDTEGVLGTLKKSPLVADATPKTEFGVSIYRDGNQIPCRAVGIDFGTSRIVKNRTTKIVAGSLPAPGSAEVAITAGMANELRLKPGDKFTAITRTATNGTNGKTFTVSGVILLSDTDYANRVFFLDWLGAGEYLRMGRNALQIQVFLRKPAEADSAAPKIQALLPAGELKADVWHTVKGIYSFLAMADFMYAIIAGIFYVLASTVIFNTTMMSVLERKKEIGTLGALGMEPGKIVALFLSESVLIATVGSVAGLLAGLVIVETVGRIGFDVGMMGGNSISGMGFSQVIYPSLSAYRYGFIFAIGLAISFLASWLPARMAARIEPAAALADR